MNFSNFFLFLPFYYQIFFISAPPPYISNDGQFIHHWAGQED